MMKVLSPKPPSVALTVTKTTYVNKGFPEIGEARSIYRDPAAPVNFRVALDNVLKNRVKLAIQFCSTPSSFHGSAPYAGWQKPTDLIETREIEVPTQSANEKSVTANIIPHTESDLVSAKGRVAEFELSLPTSFASKAGSVFFVRVVPFEGSGTSKQPLGPSSNWVRFVVVGSAKEEADKVAEKEVAAAKAKAEAQGKQLVVKAAEAQKVLRENYEFRLLSYIPPKFTDDKDAANYFVAHTGTTISYDKSKKVVNLGRGETYSVSYIRNLLNSNKTWNQELWEVTSAAINQQNAFITAAKMAVVNGIADSFEVATGVKVGAEFRAAMLTGINIALAYAGIPPSLPNIDELYDRGADYLAASIADYALEQATGVAMDEFGANPMMTLAARDAVRERAKAEVRSFIDKIAKPAPFDNQVPETWGTPAPFFRARPPMMYLEVRLRPGKKPVVGQTWQKLELQFANENVFGNLPAITMPRDVKERVVIPVALATNLAPGSWKLAGFMPHPNVVAGSSVGQPYYQTVPSAKVKIITHHRMVGSGNSFACYHTAFDLNPNLVNAIALPEKAFFLPLEQKKILDAGKVSLGPQNYYARVPYRPFSAN